jgi:hypothetical protein
MTTFRNKLKRIKTTWSPNWRTEINRVGDSCRNFVFDLYRSTDLVNNVTHTLQQFDPHSTWEALAKHEHSVETILWASFHLPNELERLEKWGIQEWLNTKSIEEQQEIAYRFLEKLKTHEGIEGRYTAASFGFSMGTVFEYFQSEALLRALDLAEIKGWVRDINKKTTPAGIFQKILGTPYILDLLTTANQEGASYHSAVRQTIDKNPYVLKELLFRRAFTLGYNLKDDAKNLKTGIIAIALNGVIPSNLILQHAISKLENRPCLGTPVLKMAAYLAFWTSEINELATQSHLSPVLDWLHSAYLQHKSSIDTRSLKQCHLMMAFSGKHTQNEVLHDFHPVHQWIACVAMTAHKKNLPDDLLQQLHPHVQTLIHLGCHQDSAARLEWSYEGALAIEAEGVAFLKEHQSMNDYSVDVQWDSVLTSDPA